MITNICSTNQHKQAYQSREFRGLANAHPKWYFKNYLVNMSQNDTEDKSKENENRLTWRHKEIISAKCDKDLEG